MRKLGVLLVFLFLMNVTVVNAEVEQLDEEIDGLLEQMIEYELNVTKEDLLESFKVYMDENNVSYTEENLKELLDQSLTDYKEYINNDEQANALSGGARKVKLIPAYKGKIFYSPTSTLGVPHGHTGLYGTESSIVHANPGRGVTWDLARLTDVHRDTVVLNVKVGKSVVDKAVSRARQFEGQGYSYVFYANRVTSIRAANCSQLVWAAYRYAGIDLDANGGPGVYPIDIYNSPHTSFYESVI